MNTQVVFKPSNVHQGHYVYINGESTGIVVNLFAYQTIEKYKIKVDKQHKMKATIKIEKEIEIKSVRVEVSVRYEEEDIPNDFPMRHNDMWIANIDIDEGRVLGWPAGQKGHLAMKVCDEGSYYLYDSDGNCVKSIEQDYVPNKLLPGKYGDYIDLHICLIRELNKNFKRKRRVDFLILNIYI